MKFDGVNELVNLPAPPTGQKYEVCDAGTTWGGCVSPPGVFFGEDFSTNKQEAGSSDRYYLDLPYSVPGTAPSPAVVPIQWHDKNAPGSPGSIDYLYPLDFQIPIENVTQVFNNLQLNASGVDQQTTDKRFGEFAFLPTGANPVAYDYAYATVKGGALAVVNLTTSRGQQPAETDLVALATNNKLWVMTGAGPGNFANQGSRGTGLTPTSVAKGDFDEDGDLDVVVANSGEASLSLFKGDGIAHFATGIPIYGVGDGPVAVIASDFNGDGHLDVAALRKGTTATPDCSVKILEGNGAGAFTAVSSNFMAGTAGTDEPTGLAVARVDADTLPDLLISTYDKVSQAGTVAFLRNSTGPGVSSNMASLATFTAGARAMGIAAGDMNGDGKPDAVIANANDGTVTIRLGDGLGGFPTATTHSLGVQGPQAVAVGFIDGDTDLDIVTVNDDPDAGDPDKVVLLIGNGTGGVESTASYSLTKSGQPAASGPRALVVGEFSEDTNPDVAVANYGTNNVSVFLGNAGGSGALTLDRVSTFGTSLSQPTALIAGEFKVQREDVVSLATKNAGYGIEIVTYQPATGPAEYYAFVTNQSQDDTNGACTSGGAPVVAETVGGVPLYLSNTVQVVKIDPSSFPATNEQITNDVRVATVAVGCGPQGLAQWKDPSNGRAYLFVANAWEGSVSRVDATRVIEDVRSAVITNPDAPLGSPYVDASRSVNVFGAPTNQGLINRDILVTDVPTPSGDPQVPTLIPYVFVTVGRLNATHSGAVVALPTSLSTTARIFTNVAGIDDPPLPLSIGGFPVGLAARTEPDPLKKLDELVLKGIDPAPPACTTPNPSTTYRRRLVIVSDSYVTATDGRDSFALLDVCSPTPGSLQAEPVAPGNGTTSEILLDDIAGTVSGSVVLSADGRRAYIAREAADTNGKAGVAVVDVNPSIFPVPATANPLVSGPPLPLRRLGYVGQQGVTSVARVPADASGAGREHILLEGNVFSPPGGPDLRGAWQMPEPLVVPYPSSRLVAAALDTSFHFKAGSPIPVLSRPGLVRGPKTRQLDGKLAWWTVGFSANGFFDGLSPEVHVADADGMNDQIVAPRPGIETLAQLPEWSADSPAGSFLTYVGYVDHPSGSCGLPSACCYPAPPAAPKFTDIFARNMSTGQVFNLTGDDHANHNDPHVAYASGTADTLTVVFTRSQNFFIGPSTCDYCPVQSIWKRTFNKTTGALGPLVQLTDPSQPAGAKSIDCVSWMSSNRSLPLGDFDPDISPASTTIDTHPSGGTYWVAFSRRFNSTVDAGRACDRAGDWDVLAVDLNSPSASLGTNFKNLTGADDGQDTICPPVPGNGPGTGICADQIPNWSPIPLPAGGQGIYRLAITTITGPPPGAAFDTSDIHVIAASAAANQRTNTQAASGGDLNLDSAAVWYVTNPANPVDLTDVTTDLLFDRIELSGQAVNQLRYLRADPAR